MMGEKGSLRLQINKTGSIEEKAVKEKKKNACWEKKKKKQSISLHCMSGVRMVLTFTCVFCGAIVRRDL